MKNDLASMLIAACSADGDTLLKGTAKRLLVYLLKCRDVFIQCQYEYFINTTFRTKEFSSKRLVVECRSRGEVLATAHFCLPFPQLPRKDNRRDPPGLSPQYCWFLQAQAIPPERHNSPLDTSSEELTQVSVRGSKWHSNALPEETKTKTITHLCRWSYGF
jgi:hypothetical protein